MNSPRTLTVSSTSSSLSSRGVTDLLHCNSSQGKEGRSLDHGRPRDLEDARAEIVDAANDDG